MIPYVELNIWYYFWGVVKGVKFNYVTIMVCNIQVTFQINFD